MLPTSPLISLGLLWESLRTLSNQVNDSYITSILLLTSYAGGRPNAYLQAIGFSEVLDDLDTIV